MSNEPNQCAQGLGCTPNGMSAGVDFAGYCRAQCRFDSECEDEERCVGALCVPVCALWEDSCPEDYWCAPYLVAGNERVGGCQLSGSRAIDESCDGIISCAEGGICIGNGITNVCWAMCDQDHPCEQGECDLLSFACHTSAQGGAGGAPSAAAGAGGAPGEVSGGAGGVAGAQ